MIAFCRQYRWALLLLVATTIAAATLAVPGAGASFVSQPGRPYRRVAVAEERIELGYPGGQPPDRGFQGSIDDLQTRLSALETSLARRAQRAGQAYSSQLSAARTRLGRCRCSSARDRQVLVAQVVASYESPPPDIATVILQAHGFADLIERVDDLKAISRENASATTHVADEQQGGHRPDARLPTLEAARARDAARC